MKRFLVLIAFLNCIFLRAQDLSQRITGRVEDKFHSPLFGAGIILIKDSVQWSTTSDKDGLFIFENIQPGRYALKVSFTGYQFWEQEVLVVSSRAFQILILLEEFPSILSEVEISASTMNEQLGEQIITIEKTLRVPANFFDPVRVITSYPGVMTANDQNNTIVIRGNSPAGLLWRINGLDVVNPNHLANAGTFSDKPAAYGGGVNIISSQLIEKTNFFSGSLPSRYGNALSGVIDMDLRQGDVQESHVTFQASLIGLDAAAEGPIGKKKNTSFLVNYRYSTVGILSAMGVKFGDEEIDFQDLTFSIDSKLAKGGEISVFGFYGTSKNIFEHKDPVDWKVEKDQFDIDYRSTNFGTGLTFNRSFKHVNISSGVAFSGNDQQRDKSQLGVYSDQLDAEKILVSGFGRVTATVNSSVLEAGISVNYAKDDLNIYDPYTFLEGNVEGVLFQPFVQWRIFLSDKWIAQTAMRYLYYTYNDTESIEPRISIEFYPTTKGSFKFSYNLVSQLQQAGTYLNANKYLELNKAHHLDLGYAYRTENGFRFTTNGYYQNLFDIPVEKFASSYSLLNSIETVGESNLASEGTGGNYGIEILAEKSFFDKSYFILGGSVYKSLYKGSDDIERSTRFDGGHSVNLTYGKEWNKNKKESLRTFGVSSRVLYLGGLRETPMYMISYGTGYVVLTDNNKAFESKLKDYFRMDLRLNWRKNKKGYTRTIALDIQNVLNIQNEASHYYDNFTQEITKQYQLGIIPILVYRVEF